VGKIKFHHCCPALENPIGYSWKNILLATLILPDATQRVQPKISNCKTLTLQEQMETNVGRNFPLNFIKNFVSFIVSILFL